MRDHSEQHGTSNLVRDLHWADLILIVPSSSQLGNLAEPAQQLGKMMEEDGTLKSKSTNPGLRQDGTPYAGKADDIKLVTLKD